MNQSKKITDGALLLAIFVVLLFISIFVPILSVFSLLFLPVPFIIYAYRYNWKPALIMFIVASIVSILFTTIFSLPMTILAGVGGVLIGSAMYKRVSAYETLARGTFGFIIGLLFAFVFTQVLFGVNWIDEIQQTVEESTEMSAALFEQFGMSEESAQFNELMELQMEYMVGLLPAFIVLMAILMAFVSQWTGYKFVNRMDRKNFHFPPFRTLQFPTSFIWIYFAVLILSLIVTDRSSLLYQPVQNILFLAEILLVIQGFSFIFFYAHHKNMSKALPIISIVLTFLLPWLFLTFVRIFGIVDIGFRLRDHLANKK